MQVNREYRDRVRAMGVAERVRRAEALFNWSREYLVRSILSARGPISDEEIKWEIARRRYGVTPRTRGWVDELRNRARR